jgi:hypothetical protein
VHLQTHEGLESDPPSADLLAYHGRTGGTVDYAITLGFDATPQKTDPYTLNLVAQLARGFTPVFGTSRSQPVSRRRGSMATINWQGTTSPGRRADASAPSRRRRISRKRSPIRARFSHPRMRTGGGRQ